MLLQGTFLLVNRFNEKAKSTGNQRKSSRNFMAEAIHHVFNNKKKLTCVDMLVGGTILLVTK